MELEYNYPNCYYKQHLFDKDGNLVRQFGDDFSWKDESFFREIDEDMLVSPREAISMVIHSGCWGMGFGVGETRRSQYLETCFNCLKWFISNHGIVFPVVYRGFRSEESKDDSKRVLIFGSRQKEVAEFYAYFGMAEYKNVRGWAYRSTAQSVVTDDPKVCDDEVVMIPDLMF